MTTKNRVKFHSRAAVKNNLPIFEVSTTLIHLKNVNAFNSFYIIQQSWKCQKNISEHSSPEKLVKAHCMSNDLFKLQLQFFQSYLNFVSWDATNDKKFRAKGVCFKFLGEPDFRTRLYIRPLGRVFALKLMEKSVLLSNRCCRIGFLIAPEMTPRWKLSEWGIALNCVKIY